MKSIITRSTLLALVLAAFACGEADVPEAATESNIIPSDSLIVANAPREPLTEDDLLDASLADLRVELPWTGNVITRDPGALSAHSFINAIDVSSHDGFDRIEFQLARETPFPGYSIRIIDGGTVQACPEEGAVDEAAEAVVEEVEMIGEEGERLLVVTFQPARAEMEGRTGPRFGIRGLGHTRLQEGGVLCQGTRAVTWVSTLAEGEQLRVLEFRNPLRLFVDVR